MIFNVSCSFIPIDFQNKKLLISKRSQFKSDYPGFWEIIGGGLITPESFEECIRREVREEIHVEINELIQSNAKIAYEENIAYINILYLGTTNTISSFEKKEIDEIKWISKFEISDYNFFPGNKDSVEFAFEEIERINTNRENGLRFQNRS